MMFKGQLRPFFDKSKDQSFCVSILGEKGTPGKAFSLPHEGKINEMAHAKQTSNHLGSPTTCSVSQTYPKNKQQAPFNVRRAAHCAC